ncbi:hypothetical protein evm_011474 [Chilo suppressalis]|nr:hypothetical protein evm_011474 [Chilo suppressalis]
MKLYGLLLSLVAVASCGPVSQDELVLRGMVGNVLDCANSDFGLCLKEQALRAAERLGTVRKLKIFEGVTILNTNPKEARSLDALPTDPEEKNKQITERLWSTASDLLQRSELELSYAGEEEEEDTESRALAEAEEGRAKKKKELKKKLKVLIPLILIAKAKAVALVVFSIVVIALSFAKLAVLAKLAFFFKAFSIIKALLAKKHQHQQEEVWATPVEESHGGGYGGHGGHVGHGWEQGWSRSKTEGNNLAYSAHRK